MRSSHTLARVETTFDDDWLYTRVALVPGDDGPPVLEVELVEPSLFLQHAGGAVDRFADAIAATARP